LNSLEKDNDDDTVMQSNMFGENEQLPKKQEFKIRDIVFATTTKLKNESTTIPTNTSTSTDNVPESYIPSVNEKKSSDRLFLPPTINRVGDKKTITLPIGELGIGIVTNIVAGPTISEVEITSPIQGIVNVGDIIISVNGTDTRCLSGVSVARILIESCNVQDRSMILKTRI
jgi:PDZ domain